MILNSCSLAFQMFLRHKRKKKKKERKKERKKKKTEGDTIEVDDQSSSDL